MYTLESIVAEVGVRELRSKLSSYLDRVREGEEVLVTDRGTPIARIVPLGRPSKYDELVRDGLIQPARATGPRWRPERRIEAKGSVSELVIEDRRR